MDQKKQGLRARCRSPSCCLSPSPSQAAPAPFPGRCCPRGWFGGDRQLCIAVVGAACWPGRELREPHQMQPTPQMSAAGRSGSLLVFFFLSSTHVGDVRTTSRKPCLPSAPLVLSLIISCSPIILKTLFKPGKGSGARQSLSSRVGSHPAHHSSSSKAREVFCVAVSRGRGSNEGAARCARGSVQGWGLPAGLGCASRAGLGGSARTRSLLIHFSCLIFRPA